MIRKIIVKGFRILRDFSWEPKEGINILVGDIASGKSTVLVAIELAMNCRASGRRAIEELSPFWFNVEDVNTFFESLNNGTSPAEPSAILIGSLLGMDKRTTMDLDTTLRGVELTHDSAREVFEDIREGTGLFDGKGRYGKDAIIIMSAGQIGMALARRIADGRERRSHEKADSRKGQSRQTCPEVRGAERRCALWRSMGARGQAIAEG